MGISVTSTTSCSPEKIKSSYQIEKQLAAQLRDSSVRRTAGSYTAVYDELFRRIPDHPQIQRKDDADGDTARLTREKLALLGRFLTPGTTYLEIGAGACELSLEVARRVARVFAVDVSREIVKGVRFPENLTFIISDSRSIDVPPGSVDVAYSNQVMEHVHPDDAIEQLGNIHRALASGGLYICITPNRLSGPHDVSKHFDEVATGLHLKEYTHAEVHQIFLSAGFSRVRAFVGVKQRFFEIPRAPLVALERLFAALPFRLRQRLGAAAPLRNLLMIIAVAVK